MKLPVPAGLALAAVLLAGCAGVPAVTAPVTFSPSPGTGTPPVLSVPSQPAAGTSAQSPAGTPSPARTGTPRRPGTLAQIADEGRVTYSVTLRPGQCRARDNGRLPDPSCTPGSTDPAVTQASIGRTICVRGWTATVRPPSAETTRAKYDVARPAYGSTTPGELDHLVPLELGGSNDITNLWPEAGAIPNGKDPVENGLRAAVCSGRKSLRAARLAVARDWETARVPGGITSAPAAASAPSPSGRTPAPLPSSHAAPVTPGPVPASCYPRTSGGNCYRAGEFCRTTDHGASGVTGNGERITCADRNGWRWGPS